MGGLEVSVRSMAILWCVWRESLVDVLQVGGGDLLRGRPLFSKGLALVLLSASLVVVCWRWRSAVPLGAVFKLVLVGVAH